MGKERGRSKKGPQCLPAEQMPVPETPEERRLAEKRTGAPGGARLTIVWMLRKPYARAKRSTARPSRSRVTSWKSALRSTFSGRGLLHGTLMPNSSRAAVLKMYCR